MLLSRVFYRLVQWLRIVTTPIDDNQVCEFAEESNPETADRHDVSSTFPPLPSPCRP